MTRLRPTRPARLAALTVIVTGVLIAPSTALPAGAVGAGAGKAASAAAADDTPRRIKDAWIVTFEKAASKEQFRSARDEAKDGGARVRYEYSKVFQGFAATMSGAVVGKLRSNKHVLSVEPDYEVHASDVQNNPANWGLDRIDQRLLPLDGSYGYTRTGSGVKAYIIDSGIRATHSDFGGRVSSIGYTAINDGRGTSDCNGHGTHVAGTVGGATYGVAKQVTLVPVRVLDCNGSGATSGVIAGVDWVTGQKQANPGLPVVANMSLGGGASSSLDSAVSRSITADVAYTVAAGNDNTNACNSSPARVGAAITVGASTKSDARAGFSNYGTCLDLFAPGEGIVSAVSSSDTASASYDGTSMAAPHVAGVIATYLQANPTASPASVRAAVVDAAGDALGINLGSGSPDKLLYSTLAAETPPPPPPPATNAAPVASAPGAVLVPTGNRLGTSGAPMIVSWSPATDTDGDAISSYALQHSTDGGSSWSTVSLPSATSRSVTVTVASSANRFRVRATDSRGAVGSWTEGTPFTFTLAQQTAATFAPSANWTNVTRSDLSGGTTRWAKNAGSTATYTFTGNQIAWIATNASNLGKAEVYLDNIKVATVDLYGSSVITRKVMFSRNGLGSGSHTLEIRVLGSRRSSSSANYVDVDAFVSIR